MCSKECAKVIARYEILKAVMKVAESLPNDGVTIVLFGGVVRDGGVGLGGEIGNPLKGAWFRSDSDIDIAFMGDSSLVLSSIIKYGQGILSVIALAKKLESEYYRFGWTHEYTMKLSTFETPHDAPIVSVSVDLVKMGPTMCKIDAAVNSLAWTPDHRTHPFGFVTNGEYTPRTEEHARMIFGLSEGYFPTIRKMLESRTAALVWNNINGTGRNAYIRMKKLMDRGFRILNPASNFEFHERMRKRRENREAAEKLARIQISDLFHDEVARVLRESANTEPSIRFDAENTGPRSQRGTLYKLLSRAIDRSHRACKTDRESVSTEELAIHATVTKLLKKAINEVLNMSDRSILQKTIKDVARRKRGVVRKKRELVRKEHGVGSFTPSAVSTTGPASFSAPESVSSEIIYTEENKAEGKKEDDAEFILTITGGRE